MDMRIDNRLRIRDMRSDKPEFIDVYLDDCQFEGMTIREILSNIVGRQVGDIDIHDGSWHCCDRGKTVLDAKFAFNGPSYMESRKTDSPSINVSDLMIDWRISSAGALRVF